MNSELQNVVAILERRDGQPSPQGLRFREPNFYYNAQAGHTLVLPEEQRPFLEFGSRVDLQVAEYGALAFGFAARIELPNGAKAPWFYQPYSPCRDPGHPRPIADLSVHTMPQHVLDLNLIVPEDGEAPAITRRAILPFMWLFRLNARVLRGTSAHMRPAEIDKAFSWLTTRVRPSELDLLNEDCALGLALTE